MLNIATSNLETLVYIGAGQCRELPKFLASNIKRIILVEPIPKLVEELKKKAQSEPRVEIYALAIAEKNLPLQQFNLLEASSLYSPLKLKVLFPGIKVVREHEVRIKSATDFIAGLSLSGNNNGLIIEASGSEETIIKSLTTGEKLGLFNYVEILGSETSLYNNGSSGAVVVEVLTTLGFELDSQEVVDTDWIRWRLSRNILQESLTRMTEKNKSLELSIHQSQIDLDKLQSEYDAQISALNTKLSKIQNANLYSKQDYRLYSKQQDEKIESLIKELDDTRLQLKTSEERCVELNSRLNESNANVKRFDGLEAKLNALTFDIGNHVDQALLASNRELESFIGLQGYLESGDAPLNYQDDRINSELALSLVGKVENNNYDLIVEFGSGVTTILFAKAVLNKSLRSEPLMLHKNLIGSHNKNRQDIKHITPADDDLPKRVISFECNKEQKSKTQKLLNTTGLDKVVELVLAPLVDFKYKEKDYLHYACDATLKRLGNMLEGREAKILVLVGGSSSDNNLEAQFPVLPKLLNTLPSHAFHVVLHGSGNGDDNIIKNWRNLLSQRGMSMDVQPKYMGGNAVFITIEGAA